MAHNLKVFHHLSRYYKKKKYFRALREFLKASSFKKTGQYFILMVPLTDQINTSSRSGTTSVHAEYDITKVRLVHLALGMTLIRCSTV